MKVRIKETERIVNISELEKVSTKALVEELQKREGVATTIAEPYKDATVSINGPAIVLTIID